MELSDKGKPVIDILQNIEGFIGYSENNFPKIHKGKSRTLILTELEDRLKIDLDYSSGKVLGAMTTPPHDFARYIYSKFIDRNLGDRGLNPGTAAIEKEVIEMLGNLLGDPFVDGNITSGGTEANIIAMLLAKQKNSNIKGPSIVIPDSAHYSFDKAAILMGLKVKRAKLLPNFHLDLNHYESLIDSNTIALVGILGTSALGLIDPIEKIGRLASKYNKYFHVDGAFGGLVVPFMEELGYKFSSYNFKIPEICSYTVDPHKMGMSVNPSGSLLVNNSNVNSFKFEIPYLAGGAFKSYNILGTRPGASAISFWALMQFMGKQGFIENVRHCLENTYYLRDQIEEIPELKIATEPTMNVLGIQMTSQANMSLEKFNSRLRQKGWALGVFKQWDLLRTVIMPHINRHHIDRFILDVKTIF